MRVALIAVLLLLSSCQPAQVISPSRKSVIGSLAQQTVKLEIVCADGKGWGSGVKLGRLDSKGRQLVATAHHVVENPAGCEVFLDNHPIEVVKQDPEHDVAIIAVSLPLDTGEVHFADIYVGMEVIIVGYPLQPRSQEAGFQVSVGNLIAMADGDYRVSAPSWFGGSGGPAFDTEGKLVGLTVSVDVFHDSFGRVLPISGGYYIVPAGRVFDLLKEV